MLSLVLMQTDKQIKRKSCVILITPEAQSMHNYVMTWSIDYGCFLEHVTKPLLTFVAVKCQYNGQSVNFSWPGLCVAAEKPL